MMKSARTFKKVIAVLAVLCLSLSLFACTQDGGSQPAASTGGTPASTGGASTGGTGDARTDLVYCIGGDIQSFDPTFSTNTTTKIVYRQMYDTLIMKDAGGEWTGMIAESWEEAEDGMSWTFNIRDDVYCHDGEKLTAEDCAYSINMNIESTAVGPMMVNMKDAEAIDETTMRLNMIEPYSAVLDVLFKEAQIFSKNNTDFDNNPIGTGPYQYVSRSSGENIVLKAFDKYYRGEAAIKDLTVKIITDTNTQIAALQKGEVDFVSGCALIAKDSVESDANLVWNEYASRATNYITMCELAAPFDNVLARQAVQYCIDKEAMLVGGNEGRGAVLNTLFPATLTASPEAGYVPEYSYDLEKAKSLLEQYKAETGAASVPVTVIISESAAYHNAGVTLEGMLREAGFDVSTETVAGKTFWASLMSSNYQIAVGGWSFPVADCDSVFPFLHSSTAGANNFSPIIDDDVDAYFESGRSESDLAKRTADYEALMRVVDENAYYIPLYQPNAAEAYNNGIKGIMPNDLAEYYVFDWSW